MTESIDAMGHGGSQDTIPGRMKLLATGALFISDGAAQLPQVGGARLILVRARSDNGASIYLGNSDVVVDTGDDSTTTGYELPSGASTPYLPVSDTSELYVVGDASDGVTYLVLG